MKRDMKGLAGRYNEGCAVVNARDECKGEGGGEGETERERERTEMCRSRVDTRIYPGCRWCSLHLILVGEIDDIILHNSGLPRRPERTVSPRGEGARGSRLAHTIALHQSANSREQNRSKLTRTATRKN